MSDTEKRNAVLDRYSGGGWHFTDHEAMADRIVELEAAVERAERILAALREPSDGVVEAVFAAMLRMDTKTKDIIVGRLRRLMRAAVAAAEQEVGP